MYEHSIINNIRLVLANHLYYYENALDESFNTIKSGLTTFVLKLIILHWKEMRLLIQRSLSVQLLPYFQLLLSRF